MAVDWQVSVILQLESASVSRATLALSALSLRLNSLLNRLKSLLRSMRSKLVSEPTSPTQWLSLSSPFSLQRRALSPARPPSRPTASSPKLSPPTAQKQSSLKCWKWSQTYFQKLRGDSNKQPILATPSKESSTKEPRYLYSVYT